MNSHPTTDWFVVGKHVARFEPPDVVHLRPNGDVSLTETATLIEFVGSLPRPEKGFIGLVDIGHAKRQDPAAMKLPGANEFLQAYRIHVFYNATFYHRTLIGIFSRVGKLLKTKGPLPDLMIFETEAQARTWIARYRE